MDNFEFKNFVREKLEILPFVEWDRYCEWSADGDKYVRVYGWVSRDDSHEDFVHLEFHRNDGEAYLLGTSSSKYSTKILHRIEDISNDSLEEEHVGCERIENLYPRLDNKIELEGGQN